MRLCRPGTSFGQGRRSRLLPPCTASRFCFDQPFSDLFGPVLTLV